jgi:hypothetical protein
MRRLGQPPRIWIELRFESPSPRLLMDALSEGEFDRLCDWITSQPALHELFVRAVDLEARSRRDLEERE